MEKRGFWPSNNSTTKAGLSQVQGRCIVNSASLANGEDGLFSVADVVRLGVFSSLPLLQNKF